MTTELTVPEMCIYLRNGIEIWVEAEKAKRFGNDLMTGQKAIVQINGQYINTVEIVGIFEPAYLEDLKRTKRGMWKCKFGSWHEKEGICECGKNRVNSWTPPTEAPKSPMTEDQLEEGKRILETLKSNQIIKEIN